MTVEQRLERMRAGREAKQLILDKLAVKRGTIARGFIERDALAYRAFCEHGDRARYKRERGPIPQEVMDVTDLDFEKAREAGAIS